MHKALLQPFWVRVSDSPPRVRVWLTGGQALNVQDRQYPFHSFLGLGRAARPRVRLSPPPLPEVRLIPDDGKCSSRTTTELSINRENARARPPSTILLIELPPIARHMKEEWNEVFPVLHHDSVLGDTMFVANRNGSNAKKIFAEQPGAHQLAGCTARGGRGLLPPRNREISLGSQTISSRRESRLTSRCLRLQPSASGIRTIRALG